MRKKDERQFSSSNSRVLSVKITCGIYTDQQHKSPTGEENDQYSVGVENPAFNPGIHVNIMRAINPSTQ